MPKLSKRIAKEVDKQEGGGFTPIPDGVYEMILKDVTVAEGPSGPYWKWEFAIPSDAEEYAGRKFWLNTSLAEAALWKFKEVFTAFGVTPDTDTDELIGDKVKAVVSTRTIQAGARAGEQANQIDKVRPFETDAEEDEEEWDEDEESDDDEEEPKPVAKKKDTAKPKPAKSKKKPVEDDEPFEDEDEDEDEDD